MDPTIWKRVRELFEAAINLPEAERTSYLDASSEEPHIIEEAKALLKATREGVSAFEPPTPVPGDAAPTALVVDIPRGSKVGQFTVERRIGEGGMANVYAASQTRPSRQVALKVLRGGLSPRAIKRFEYEAEILGQLKHPAIAQVYDTGETHVSDQTIPYIAMEYIEGAEDLLSYARRKELNRKERLRLFLEFADAIQYGHEHGVLHRDIKPSNLLVSEYGLAKVIDYGIARAELMAESDRTLTGEVFGTLGYIAPERLRGNHGADTRSEVYSLGVVLFELLTGKPPLDLKALSFVDAVDRIERQEPRRPSMVLDSIPEGLDWIAVKALSIDRKRRYAGVSELVADIHRHLAGEGVLAGAPSKSYRIRSWLRRNRVLTWLLVVAGIGTIATIVGTRVGLKRAEQQTVIAKKQAAINESALGLMEMTLKHANALQGGVDARVSTVLESIDHEVQVRFAEEPLIAQRLDALLASAYIASRDLNAAGRILERTAARSLPDDPYANELARQRSALGIQLGGHEKAFSELSEMIVEIDSDPSLTDDTHAQDERLQNVCMLFAALAGQGKFEQAAALANEEIHNVHPGSSPKLQSQFFEGCGHAFRKVGRLEEAQEILAKSIEFARKAERSDYQLMTSLRAAGTLEMHRNRSNDARAHLAEAIAIADAFLGDGHPETATTHSIMAEMQLREDDFEGALAAYERIAEMPGYPKVSWRNRMFDANTRIHILSSLKRKPEALELSKKTVADIPEGMSPGDPVALDAESMLASLLITDGQTEAGMALLDEVIARAEQAHGSTGTLTFAMRERKITSSFPLKLYDEVIVLCDEQIEGLRGNVSPEHPFYWNAHQLKLDALVRLRKPKEATEMIAVIRKEIDLARSPTHQKRIKNFEAKIAALEAE